MSDKSFSVDTTLAFDEGKQASILGWCLRDKLFAMQCANAIKPEWFSSPLVGKLFAATMSIYNSLGRLPSANEVKQHRPLLQEDARTKLYNAKKVDDAWKAIDEASLVRTTSTFEDGTNQGFLPSSERILREGEERDNQAPRVLKYGVKYLDDALGGIIPNDLIVIGAKTGMGKTQLATSIALSNAQSGVPVHYFALEAENDEIERRIKYGMISKLYHKLNPDHGKRVPISYTDWRMGRINGLVGGIEKDLREDFSSTVKNLHTLYRTSGAFDIANLEKGLLQVVKSSRLIIIDHLHYIDTDDDENSAYKKVIKVVRDIVLKYSIPIVVIAHLRKTMGKGQPLINTIEDFHGTSDVPKVATTCVMISPAPWEEPYKPAYSYLYPTFIGAVKSRLDGDRTRFTGLAYFDRRSNRYIEEYRIGRMMSMNQEWDELRGEEAPPWAHPGYSMMDVVAGPGIG